MGYSFRNRCLWGLFCVHDTIYLNPQGAWVPPATEEEMQGRRRKQPLEYSDFSALAPMPANRPWSLHHQGWECGGLLALQDNLQLSAEDARSPQEQSDQNPKPPFVARVE